MAVPLGSVGLSAGIAVVGLETEFRREFGESVMDVHFDAVVFATAFVRWFERTAIGRAGEGEQFIEAVAEAAQRAIGSGWG